MKGKSHGFEELLKSVDDLFRLGDFAQALEGYQRVRKEYGSSVDSTTMNLLKRKELECLYKLGRYEESLRGIEELGPVYESQGDTRQLGWLLHFKAYCLKELGRLEEGKRVVEEAKKLLEGTVYNLEYGLALKTLGNIKISLGDLKEAKKLLIYSISAFHRVSPSPQREIISSQNLLGQVCFMRGESKEAIEHLTEALDLCRQNKGNTSQEAMLLGNLGTVHRRAGAWSKAEGYLRSNLKLCEEMNNTLFLSHGYVSLARLLIMQRNFDEAEELLQRAESLSQAYPREKAMICESLGDLAIERGQFQRAKGYYQRTLDIGRRVAPQGDLINQVQRRRAELFIAEGKDLDEASECVQEALRVSQSLGDRFEEGCCYRTMGKLNQVKGDIKSAEVNFERAVAVLRSLEDRFELANTLLAQGEFNRRIDLLREAKSLFAQIQGAEFYQALVLLQIAKVGSSFKAAVKDLGEAERILRAQGELEKLKEVESLKIELNQRLKSFPAEKYQVLEGLSSEDLGSVFGRLIEEVGADRGFVAYGGDGRKGMETEASHNLTKEETKGFLSLLADGDGFEVGCPSILYDSSLDKRFSATWAGSLMLIPYGDGERAEGYLYADRQRGKEPFLERELDLFYLLSERVAKAIAEQRQRELERANLGLRQRLAVQGIVPEEIITQNEKMLEVLRKVDRSKDYKATVLIKGQSGTGKELIAQRIHYTSRRGTRRFVSIDCGAIPEELFEAEVFGCERGAFTGALLRKGLIEEADGGTLFLDEVGNLSLRHQAKFLRVLEEGKVRRVGSNKERPLDVRVIAATNKDLTEEIKKRKFRGDLYYRLKQMVIELPPLRERRDDIRLLAQYFVDIYSCEFKKRLDGITEEALQLLEGYSWPGNVRELKNEIERAAIIADEGKEITPRHLSQEVRASNKGKGVSGQLKGKRELTMEALEQSGWNMTKAAQSLGITRQGLIKRVKRFSLERAKIHVNTE